MITDAWHDMTWQGWLRWSLMHDMTWLILMISDAWHVMTRLITVITDACMVWHSMYQANGMLDISIHADILVWVKWFIHGFICVWIVWIWPALVQRIFNSSPPFREVIFKLILVVDNWGMSCEISLRWWMLLDLTSDKSTWISLWIRTISNGWDTLFM